MTTYARIVKENQQIGEQIGIQKGEQIGIQIGATKKINEFVLSSHENGIAISLIANITKLSEEDIMKILKENGKL
jgi:predicted transposase YdaD